MLADYICSAQGQVSCALCSVFLTLVASSEYISPCPYYLAPSDMFQGRAAPNPVSPSQSSGRGSASFPPPGFLCSLYLSHPFISHSLVHGLLPFDVSLALSLLPTLLASLNLLTSLLTVSLLGACLPQV